jgi:NAD(P)-dependent dehydrogenase (short-subunit alcohol dehydrogenase family)
VEQIQRETGNPAVDLMLADLSLMAEVRCLADRFQNTYSRLDVLVNNAGGSFMRRQETEEGLELTFALNYLSPFLLTNLLLEPLEDSAPARIVNVASEMHRRAEIRFDDLQLERGYNIVRAYAQSKLALVTFTFHLARCLEGSGVTANALHPGFVATEIWEKAGFPVNLLAPLIGLFAASPEEGAETVVYLAASPEVADTSGRYFVDKEPVHATPVAYDEETAQQLWEVSESLVTTATERGSEVRSCA